MAEIEHFVNPNDKAHPRFKLVSAKGRAPLLSNLSKILPCAY
jgi:glycyl-tRNA synthetase (class II)